ncbi:MAG: aminomethyl-transferring glycine dehydrogenase subunit GcvPA [Candidatus Zipacnadales bacterium]
MSYLPHSDRDRAEMLASLRIETVEDLFRDIPMGLRESARPNLPPPLTEAEIVRHMQDLAGRNSSLDQLVCFAGGGIYDHFIPSIVFDVIARPEFKTGYTPYQPEASQGILQAFFEYQSMLCDLTGMPIANASLYDGASALGEALLLAAAQTGRCQAVVSRALSPNARAVAHTYCQAMGVDIVEVPYEPITGRTDMTALQAVLAPEVCCVALQQPNYFGVLEDMDAASEAAHRAGALFVASVEPISLAVLRSPGEYEADIVVGEGQPLGLLPGFGGPLLGLFACREEMLRRLPGRIVGETVDTEGRRAYCLTLQAREQHIRREKATSNICTSETLCALTSAVYLAALGPLGLREVAENGVRKAHYLRDRLAGEHNLQPRFSGVFWNEFVLDVGEVADEVVDRLAERGYLVGPALGREYPELRNCLLLAVTEQRTCTEIDGLVAALGAN